MKWARNLIALCILAFAMTLTANADQTESVRISDRLCVLESDIYLSSEEAVDRLDDFDCTEDALKQGATHLWLSYDITDLTKRFEDPALKIRVSYHNAITLSEISDGQIVNTRTIAPEQIEDWMLIPAAAVFPIAAEGQTIDQILIGVEDVWDYGNWFEVDILGYAAAQRSHLELSVIFSLMVGLLITPLVIICVVYPILRHRFLLFHFGMVSCALIYGLSWCGFLNFLPGTIEPALRANINYITMPLAVFFAALFTRDFVGKHSIGEDWYKTLFVGGCVPLVGGVIAMLFAPRFSAIGPFAYHLLFLVPLVAIWGALIHGSLKGKLICQLQFAAWTPMLLFMGGRIARGAGIIEESAFLELGLFPALLSEALLTTSVIGYKIYGLRKERDIAVRNQITLENLAHTDSLTGALNRRAFVDHFDQIVGSGLTQNKTVSLLMIDIDHFKRLNDEHGHSFGDQVLVQLTRLLADQCREQDQCARFGGEEFGLLITTDTNENADFCASRLLKTVSRHKFENNVQVTISIGIIEISTPMADFDQWYVAADKALYAAKTAGRNRVQRSSWRPTRSNQSGQSDIAWAVK